MAAIFAFATRAPLQCNGLRRACSHQAGRRAAVAAAAELQASSSAAPSAEPQPPPPPPAAAAADAARLQAARDKILPLINVRAGEPLPRVLPICTLLLVGAYVAYELYIVRPTLAPPHTRVPDPLPEGAARALGDGRLLMDDGRIVRSRER